MTLQIPFLPFDLSQPYGLDKHAKQALLLDSLNILTQWHQQQCEPYRNILAGIFKRNEAQTLEDLPFVPVKLFKTLDLASVRKEEIVKTLMSSGTTGQAVSKIYLDRETSVRQTRVLAAIMASFLGPQRLPMVIVDSADLLKDRTRFNARAAGILGFSTFGRKHHYCLDDQLKLKLDELQDYLNTHQDQPILLFGFTFVVWQGLYEGALHAGIKLNFGQKSTLIHGGGWKRLIDQQVSNEIFKQKLKDQLGIERVFNYYGMVEQVGSIFMECEQKHLHSPVFADIIVRNPITLEPLPFGHIGVIEVLSALPLSYPGHALLTEDMGVIHGEDDCPCGRLGRYFSISGRLPKVEMRGCSDTRSMP
jgi:phenylacetate-coenzyme A ligase PaaK-like adenylate-forming protein